MCADDMAKTRYFGWDFGGTNMRGAEVDPETGAIIGKIYTRSLHDIDSNAELVGIVDNHTPKKAAVGISAAGDIDEESLEIKICPNSRIKGSITFAKHLRAKGHKVTITNDMKAAVQGAARFGEGRDYRNVLVATFSSGFNCAVARDRVCVTTAEFGHMKGFNDHYCGCGQLNHLEFDVSGNGAASRAKQYFEMTRAPCHAILDASLKDIVVNGRIVIPKGSRLADDPGILARTIQGISSKHVYGAFQRAPGQEPQRSIREHQVEAIAASIGMMLAAYNPLDVMVFMGSQTKDWHVVFKPAIDRYVARYVPLGTLRKPGIVRNTMPEIGVQGAIADYITKMEGH